MTVEPAILLTALAIFCLRIVDVSLGTMRVVMVMRGRRALALTLGFFEVLIWVFAVGTVVNRLDEPIIAVFYALGFAAGNYVGVTIEGWLALGQQMVSIYTHEGSTIAKALREEGYRVTSFEGEGRDGSVTLLVAKGPRRLVPKVCRIARSIDHDCFYMIADLRAASVQPSEMRRERGFRARVKKV